MLNDRLFNQHTFQMKNYIKLQANSVKQVPLQNFEKDFTFIINSKKFETSSFVADLISPQISRLHSINPTTKEYVINTNSQGDFQKILNLINFDRNEIQEKDIPFIIEIFNKLGTNNIEFNIETKQEEITIDNAIEQLLEHQKYPQFFNLNLTKEVKFISTHFSEMQKKLIKEINENNIDISIIEMIIGSDELILENENQLLQTINALYLKDNRNSIFYKFVDFANVEISSLNEFISIFDYNDLTKEMWDDFISCFKNQIQNSNDKKECKHKYKKQKPKGIEFQAKNNEFNGIFKYLKTQSNIKNEIQISASSICSGQINDLLDFDDKSSFFETNSKPNSWICFEFINHKIIPSSYIIRTIDSENNDHLKSWIVEGSNDNKNWIKIDENQNCSHLKGSEKVHLFTISKHEEQMFKYIRIQQTGPNWYSGNNQDHHLCMSAIEFYGILI